MDHIKKNIVNYYSQEIVQNHLFRYVENRVLNFRMFDKHFKEEGFQHDLHSMEAKRYLSEPLPEWVLRNLEMIYTDSYSTKVPYFICRNKKLLSYFIHDFPFSQGLFQMEVHPWMSRYPDFDRPDYAIINLRPDLGEWRFDYLLEVALIAREAIAVPTYVKLSEEKGLHIYIPLNGHFNYEFAQDLTGGLIREIHKKCENISLLKPIGSDRKGKILLDVSQNNNKGSVIAPYSLIADPSGRVAAPLKWEEVNASLDPGKFTIQTMASRIKEVGDLFEPLVQPRPTSY